MPTFAVETAQRTYASIVERGILKRTADFIPAHTGKIFVVTTRDVWAFHHEAFEAALKSWKYELVLFAGGESNKRLSVLESLAEDMVAGGADRSSLVIGFGGGIVTDISGFLAAIFMRGIPVLQIPTTLLAQVDAAVGGKTGVNLQSGKNLVGSFHQPLAVLIDPNVIATLPQREYRAGLFEVIKCGVIRDRHLFDLLEKRARDVLALEPELVDELISGAVRVKAEVVTADEKESDLRRILNFGHTVGHAIEAETGYVRLLHGEAVAWGMLAATRLAELLALLGVEEASRIVGTIFQYGPLPPVSDLSVPRLIERFSSDKKTMQGKVHFVLPLSIGQVVVKSGIETQMIQQAMDAALGDAH